MQTRALWASSRISTASPCTATRVSTRFLKKTWMVHPSPFAFSAAPRRSSRQRRSSFGLRNQRGRRSCSWWFSGKEVAWNSPTNCRRELWQLRRQYSEYKATSRGSENNRARNEVPGDRPDFLVSKVVARPARASREMGADRTRARHSLVRAGRGRQRREYPPRSTLRRGASLLRPLEGLGSEK